MILVVDVGNSNTVIGAFIEGELRTRWRMRTEARITKDELRAKILAFLNFAGLGEVKISGVVLATVVPDLNITWRVVCKEMTGTEMVSVVGGEDYGLKYDHPSPAFIGADRIANAVAAIELHKAPAIVVDFGTATNIDVINRDGEFCGGTISPGVDISLRALFERASLLSTVQLKAPRNVIGKSTEEELRAGILYGAASQAEGLVRRIKESLGEEKSEDCTVIATGGMAQLISKFTNLFDVVDQDLTIQGLYRIAKRMELED